MGSFVALGCETPGSVSYSVLHKTLVLVAAVSLILFKCILSKKLNVMI